MLPNYETSHIGAPIPHTYIHILIETDTRVYIRSEYTKPRRKSCSHAHKTRHQTSSFCLKTTSSPPFYCPDNDTLLSCGTLRCFIKAGRPSYSLHINAGRLTGITRPSYLSESASTHDRISDLCSDTAADFCQSHCYSYQINSFMCLFIYLCIYTHYDSLVKLTWCLNIKTSRGGFRRNYAAAKVCKQHGDCCKTTLYNRILRDTRYFR